MKPFPRPHWKGRAEALRDFLESHGFHVIYTKTTAEIVIYCDSRLPTELPAKSTPKPWWRAWWAGGGRKV